MKTFSLAQRNLLRNGRRSLATVLAVAIGSASILLFGGYSANIKYSMQTAYVANGGHLQVQHSSFHLYGSGDPTKYGISDYGKILEAIARDPALHPLVHVATPTLQFGGIAGNYAAGVSRPIIGNGFVAADYNRMRQWNDYQVPQAYPPFALDGAPADAALVGIGLARVLQLCEALKIANCPQPKKGAVAEGEALPDDIAQLSLQDAPVPKSGPASLRSIELLASSTQGSPNVVSLEVVRAENQGFKELDEVYVQLHLAQAQRLIYGKSAPKVTAIMVQLQQSDQMPAARGLLAKLLSTAVPGQPLVVMDYKTLNPFYVQSLMLFDTIFGFMFVLIGSIVLFSVGNTMNTAVIERAVEIGTLRAIGLRRADIQRLFVVEGALLGLVGAGLGLVSALLIAGAVNRMGLTWLPPGTAAEVPLNMRVWGQNALMLTTTCGLVAIASLSAWWPAYRAANMDVVEALRHA